MGSDILRLIITGGAGFIGSNLILHWIKNHPEDEILNVDKLTYAANLDYLKSVANCPKYHFLQVDLINRAKIRNLICEFQPEGIIHLAAESHVDNSIKGPEAFVLTNIVGTFNILEEARQFWSNELQSSPEFRFLHVSTDEVYGSLGSEGCFLEESPYAPNSPYSATKASSDHLVNAYFHTYGMNTVVTNCSNNFGPHQHREKLIPTVIRRALAGEPIPVYGQGLNVRDWLYVDDHCLGLDVVFHKGKNGESYNIGGQNEWRNIDLIQKICEILNQEVGAGPSGDYRNLITFVTDRLGHDFRYAINPQKIEKELGWKASTDFEENLRSTIKWYLEAGL
jgi:dTDP-glucose 4,6-dehydratase